MISAVKRRFLACNAIYFATGYIPSPLLSSRAKRSEAKDLGNIKMDEHVDALEILRYALNDNKQGNSPLERGRGCVMSEAKNEQLDAL